MVQPKGKIGIIGSGKIGHCWAVLFSAAGYQVVMYDIAEDRLQFGMDGAREKIKKLTEEGLSRTDLSFEDQMSLISATTDLSECIKDAIYIQECVIEKLDLKLKVFGEIDALAIDGQILASSTSCIEPSKFSKDLKHKEYCLVVHPVNPPVYAPVVEVVPAPWTKVEVVDKAEALMKEIGQVPVRFSREVVGFGVNRLQYAVITEAWRMVQDGIVSVEGVNKLVSEGLGLRWAFYGALEVPHMNGDGIVHHNQTYGNGMVQVLKDYGPIPDFFDKDTLGKVAQELDKVIPVTKMDAHRQHREQQLAALAQLKKHLNDNRPSDL